MTFFINQALMMFAGWDKISRETNTKEEYQNISMDGVWGEPIRRNTTRCLLAYNFNFDFYNSDLNSGRVLCQNMN